MASNLSPVNLTESLIVDSLRPINTQNIPQTSIIYNPKPHSSILKFKLNQHFQFHNITTTLHSNSTQMGNFTSCFNPFDSFNPTLQFATLIDIHGNQRRFKTPITAAEIMLLEQPGFLISPVGDDLRSSFRLSGLRAEEVLSNGKVYLLIPIGRLNSFVTESELEMLQSGCGKAGRKNGGGRRRRQAKVLPEERSGGDGGGLGSLGEGFAGQRVCSSPVWTPVLEPIYE